MYLVDGFRRWQFRHFQASKLRTHRSLIRPQEAFYRFLESNNPATREDICTFFMANFQYDSWASCRSTINRLVAREVINGGIREDGAKIRLLSHTPLVMSSEIGHATSLMLLFWITLFEYLLHLTSFLVVLTVTATGVLFITETYDAFRTLKLHASREKNGTSSRNHAT